MNRQNTRCPECGEEHSALFRGCPWCKRKRKEGESVRDVNRRMLREAVAVIKGKEAG